MNISSLTNKVKFWLMGSLMILASLINTLQMISAQSVAALTEPTAEITIAVSGSVRTDLGRNANQLLGIVAPEYPVRAQQRRITGWSLVRFSVDEYGFVDAGSIVVVDSEPSGMFDAASIRSASQFEFRPRIVNGAEVGVSGLQYVFRYVWGERASVVRPRNARNRDYLPLNLITPEYPLAAKEENIEGYVLVEFTVTKQGLPRGIVILDRSPSNIFNAAAISAAERFRFDPRIMDGEPVEAEGAQYLFTFEQDD